MNNTFLKKLSFITSGTILSQLILIVGSPFQTRVFSPEDFASFAVFIALSSLFSIFAVGRFDIAFTQAENEKEAYGLFFASIILSLFSTLVIVPLLVITAKYILEISFFDNITVLESIIGSFIFSLYSITLYWSNRNQEFKKQLFTKTSQSLIFVLFSLLTSQLIGKALIYGYIIGLTTSVLILIPYKVKWQFLKYADIKIAVLKFKAYPINAMPFALVDNLATSMPLYIAKNNFTSSFVGNYSLAIRMLAIPSSVVSNALSQVVLVEASLNKKNNISNKGLFNSLLLKLIFVGVIPFAIILVKGDVIFSIIFGENWVRAGEIAQMLAIPFFIIFVVSSLSSFLISENRIKINSIWQALNFGFVLLFMLIITINPYENTYLTGLAVIQSISYIMYFGIIYRIIK